MSPLSTVEQRTQTLAEAKRLAELFLRAGSVPAPRSSRRTHFAECWQLRSRPREQLALQVRLASLALMRGSGVRQSA